MIPAYLNPERLLPRMVERPVRPFFVRPGVYTIIDGDTFRLRTPEMAPGGLRDEAFRIRLPNIDTPELRKPAMFDKVLSLGGFDPFRDGPGELARDKLREWCRGKVLLIDPLIEDGRAREDRYHRLLAHVAVSGSPGREFDLDGAWSVEWGLLKAGLCQVMPGRPTPPMYPPALEAVAREMRSAQSHVKTVDSEGPQL